LRRLHLLVQYKLLRHFFIVFLEAVSDVNCNNNSPEE
jgi:hypothetical protein